MGKSGQGGLSMRARKIVLATIAVIAAWALLLTFLSTCSLEVFTSYTVFERYEFEKAELPLPHGGVVSVELSPDEWESEISEEGEHVEINRGPYSVLMYFNYAKGTEGVVRVKEVRLSQEPRGKYWIYGDFTNEPLRAGSKKFSYVPCIIHDDIDLNYDEVRLVIKAVVKIEGHEPEEVVREQVIKTKYRRYRYNDLLRAIRSV